MLRKEYVNLLNSCKKKYLEDSQTTLALKEGKECLGTKRTKIKITKEQVEEFYRATYPPRIVDVRNYTYRQQAANFRCNPHVVRYIES